MDSGAASITHPTRPRQHVRDIDTDERRRHEAENRQRRIAPADLFRRIERRAKFSLSRQLLERSSRVGNGDEVLPWLNIDLLQLVPEVIEERIGFRGGP